MKHKTWNGCPCSDSSGRPVWCRDCSLRPAGVPPGPVRLGAPNAYAPYFPSETEAPAAAAESTEYKWRRASEIRPKARPGGDPFLERNPGVLKAIERRRKRMEP